MSRTVPFRTMVSAALLVVLLSSGLISIGIARTVQAEVARSAVVASTPSRQSGVASADRVALVIGNARYPDADAALPDVANDANLLADALRKAGFVVETVHDGTRAGMRDAADRLTARVHPGTIVLVYFGGFGVQSQGDNYLIPVDATIWTEADVRRDGLSIEQLLADLENSGARIRLAVIDASRRNPYERRFRDYSHGLAPVDLAEAGANALVIMSTEAEQVIDEPGRPASPYISALAANMNSQMASVQQIFDDTRTNVAHATADQQIPTVLSTLTQNAGLGSTGRH
jgi:uncharacterized caspase-like protein